MVQIQGSGTDAILSATRQYYKAEEVAEVQGVNAEELKVEDIVLKNFTGAPGYVLPETGGPGTTILTIGGLLLMAGAVGGGYGLRRRRGKEGR